MAPPEHKSHRRAKDFVELHNQVQASINLLDTLESFLSTFQADLSAVSGQISELQDRSTDIDNRLKSRKKIERPLSSLISDVTIPPNLATMILDSEVSEPWITAIDDFERRLETIKARTRVKAARDLGEVAEGLRLVAATKLRAFFLALFQPIRASVTTNMQVIQTSILLKYGPLFAFLQRQAANVAHELQRSYVGAARVYYETGFRRYSRSLGWIKARSAERHESIVSTEREFDVDKELGRSIYAKIEGPSVTLAYMADDKAHKEPIEALLRSLFLVFMDNASAEYAFVQTFFSVAQPLFSDDPSYAPMSPTSLLSPDRGAFAERRTFTGSESGDAHTSTRVISHALTSMTEKEQQSATETIWKQIFDPVLQYCEAFVKSVLDPIPPVTSLLTMIRLTEDVIVEVQKRNCPPVEFFVFSLRLQMWPVYQKAMADHIETLKKLAEGTSSGYFSRGTSTTDASVMNICKRYALLFNSFVKLTQQEEETMVFSNLSRLRQELSKLILRHTNNISEVVARSTAQSKLYDSLLQVLSQSTRLTVHPKSQQEIAYWANLEEEARRKIAAADRTTG